MKASELIMKLAKAVSVFGDLDVLIRDCSNGYDYDCAAVTGDPASDAETEIGIKGTIDLNIWCASGSEPYIRFGENYLFDSCDHGTDTCTVLRLLTQSERDFFDVGNMYLVRFSSGAIGCVYEDELKEIENDE